MSWRFFCAPLVPHTPDSPRYLDETYDATQPLADGTVYFVTNNVTFSGAYDGSSGLAVAPGAEVVIFVRENCTLHAIGVYSVNGEVGGGAGILCPSNSTLIVTGQGAQLLIEDEKDDSKKTWANVAAHVKEKLVGVVRPICTAEIERDRDGDISKVTYKPVLDINDHPVVREITADDLDEIGEAVMATIIEGA